MEVIEKLFLQWRPYLLAKARMLCGDIDEAEDIVQDTYLQACLKREQLRDEKAASGWLLTILVNVYRAKKRKVNRQLRTELGAFPEPAVGLEPIAFEESEYTRCIASQVFGAEYAAFLDAFVATDGNKKMVTEKTGMTEGTQRKKLWELRQFLLDQYGLYDVDEFAMASFRYISDLSPAKYEAMVAHVKDVAASQPMLSKFEFAATAYLVYREVKQRLNEESHLKYARTLMQRVLNGDIPAAGGEDTVYFYQRGTRLALELLALSRRWLPSKEKWAGDALAWAMIEMHQTWSVCKSITLTLQELERLVDRYASTIKPHPCG